MSSFGARLALVDPDRVVHLQLVIELRIVAESTDLDFRNRPLSLCRRRGERDGSQRECDELFLHVSLVEVRH
jgi:hypothetical protein